MFRYLVERLIWAMLMMLGVSLVTFMLIYMIPDDPIRMMEDLSLATSRTIRIK